MRKRGIYRIDIFKMQWQCISILGRFNFLFFYMVTNTVNIKASKYTFHLWIEEVINSPSLYCYYSLVVNTLDIVGWILFIILKCCIFLAYIMFFIFCLVCKFFINSILFMVCVWQRRCLFHSYILQSCNKCFNWCRMPRKVCNEKYFALWKHFLVFACCSFFEISIIRDSMRRNWN